MSLPNLPNELILLISQNCSDKALHRLSKTCKIYNALLAPELRKRALEDKDGLTALQWAAKRGHRDLALYLLEEKGVDVNEMKGGRGMAPIHLAALEGSVEMLGLLVKFGADVDCRSRNKVGGGGGMGMGGGFLSGVAGMGKCTGWTPLHWSVGMGKKAAVEVLLQCGATRWPELEGEIRAILGPSTITMAPAVEIGVVS